MVAHGTALVPTAMQLNNFPQYADQAAEKFPAYAATIRDLHARRRDTIMAAYEAGVPIYAGTDAGGVLPHGGIAGEVAELAAYGIPVEDALARRLVEGARVAGPQRAPSTRARPRTSWSTTRTRVRTSPCWRRPAAGGAAGRRRRAERRRRPRTRCSGGGYFTTAQLRLTSSSPTVSPVRRSTRVRQISLRRQTRVADPDELLVARLDLVGVLDRPVGAELAAQVLLVDPGAQLEGRRRCRCGPRGRRSSRRSSSRRPRGARGSCRGTGRSCARTARPR